MSRRTPPPGETVPGPRIRIPFVQTEPVTDLGLVFVLLPLWWALGVEQVIWPASAAAVAAKVLVRKRRLPECATLRWLSIFVAAHVLSAAAIDDPVRWITFLRNLGMYVGALCLLVALLGAVERWNQARFLLGCVLFAAAAAAAAGLAGILGIWRGEYETPVGWIMPDWMAHTDYGGRIARHSLGRMEWFLGVRYFRLTSLFLYPAEYATTLAMVLPPAVFLCAECPPRRRRLLLILLPLLAVNILFTAARVPVPALVIGWIGYLTLRGGTRRMLLRGLAIGAAVGIGGIALLVAAGAEERAGRAVLRLVSERSLASRGEAFAATFRGILERPVLGWGTERDVEGAGLPAGSHSTYLGVLYKHGLVGFIPFLFMLFALLRETRPPPETDTRSTSEPGTFLRFGRWILAVALICGSTQALDLDATLMAVTWLLFGLLIVAGRLGPPAGSRDEPSRPSPAADVADPGAESTSSGGAPAPGAQP